MSSLILRELQLTDEKSFRAAVDEFKQDDFVFAFEFDATIDFQSYVQKTKLWKKGEGYAAKFVPSSFLVAVVANKIVGRASIRHELNEGLLRTGGHIGYGVVPSERGKGYATEILKQSVLYAKNLGVKPLLVTCDEQNIGSIKTIEKNGGILENKIQDGALTKRRYWIQ